MRCSFRTKKTLKLTGTGRNWKKKRTARNWQRILKCRSLLARKSSKIRTSLSKSSRTLLPPKTNRMWSWLTEWMMILISWLVRWSFNSSTWELITLHSWPALKTNSKEKGPVSSKQTSKRLKNYSSFIKKLRKNSPTEKCVNSRRMLRSWKSCVHEMRMSRLTRKFSSKRKCRRLRSAWKIWKLFSNLTIRSWSLTMMSSGKERK